MTVPGIESQNDHRGQKWAEWKLVRFAREPVLKCHPAVISSGEVQLRMYYWKQTKGKEPLSAEQWEDRLQKMSQVPGRGKEGRKEGVPNALSYPMLPQQVLLCTPEASSVHIKS